MFIMIWKQMKYNYLLLTKYRPININIAPIIEFLLGISL